eukprot:TRINITY_DN34580_c0_g1_i1.p1 TRINITY_DN34580_c0_g1~~TRINITY_DN34580_c0_g1_i1.p1  ORF type:complete len:904 (+),score=125.12 TRINITY_DN34580_c0_g1_i1:173-2713(+)
MPKEGTGSTQWFINQIIVDDDVFTTEPRTSLEGKPSVLASPKSEPRQSAFSRFTKSFTSRASKAAKWDVPQDQSVDPVQLAEADLAEAFQDLQDSEKMGDFQERVIEVFLRFLVSKACGFQVRTFASVDRDELFVAVAGCDKILRAHADQMQYQTQLDEDFSIHLLRGSFSPSEIHPPYVKYSSLLDKRFRKQHGGRPPFKQYPTYDSSGNELKGQVFGSVDRLKIMKAVVDRTFSLGVMRKLGLIVTHYPLHETASLVPLSREWGNWRLLWSYSVPLEKVRAYFGESVSFRLCQLSVQSRLLVPFLVLAPILALLQYTSIKQYAMLISSIIFMSWSFAYLLIYQREESRCRMSWGMDNFAVVETKRPEFTGAWTPWAVDRHTIVKRDLKSKWKRLFTNIVTVVFMAAVIGATVALYAYEHNLKARGATNVSWINFALTIEMRIWTSLWEYLATKLTDYDNYETESAYFQALVFRVFVFQFVNSFSALFYTAFFKHMYETCGSEGVNCTAELSHQLLILFAANLFFHVLAMVQPLVTYRIKLHAEEAKGTTTGTTTKEKSQTNEKTPSPGGQAAERRDSRRNSEDSDLGEADKLLQTSAQGPSHSYQESQAKMNEYDLVVEVWERVDAIIELAYVTFFGFVAPSLLLIFWLSTVMRVRAMGWTLLNVTQRPYPKGASGIGSVFDGLYNLTCGLAVAVNISLLMIYSARQPGHDMFERLKEMVAHPVEGENPALDWKTMLVILLLWVISVFGIWRSVVIMIGAVPSDVLLDVKRREIITHRFQKVVTNANVEHPMAVAYAKLSAASTQVHARKAAKGSSWQPGDPINLASGKNVLPWDQSDPWFETV